MSMRLKFFVVLAAALFLLGCPSQPKPPEKPPETVATPVVAPADGTFTEPVDISVQCATDGAEIRYTLDGSDPTAATGNVYRGPFRLSASAAVKAAAFKTDWLPSAVAAASIRITGTVAAPKISLPSDTYQNVLDVALSCATEGAEIRYTLDGSDPTASSGTVYSGAVAVKNSATLKAAAFKSEWKPSPVSSAVYKLLLGTVVAPTFSLAGGTYIGSQAVTIASATAGAEIRYTLDGTNPTPATGLLYTAPVRVAQNATLRAMAWKPDWMDSLVIKADYTILAGVVQAPTFQLPAGVTYVGVQNVAISSATVGAEIRYTMDGSVPTVISGSAYKGPVAVAASTTLKAIAYRSGWQESPVASISYTVLAGIVSAPAFNPAPGNYKEPQRVTISSDAGAEIRYTLDGSAPTPSGGIVYKGPVDVPASATLKALAVKPNWKESAVSTAGYTITIPVPPKPLADRDVLEVRNAIARAKDMDADFYDLKNIDDARNLLQEALKTAKADPDKARQLLASAKSKADLAYQTSVALSAKDFQERMASMDVKLKEAKADLWLPSDYSKAASGIGESQALYQKADVSGARARVFRTLKEMADLFEKLNTRLAGARDLKRDVEESLAQAESADAARWAPDQKEKANAYYLKGMESFQAYKLVPAEESFGAARIAAGDALRLAREKKAQWDNEEKKKADELMARTQKALQEASKLTVVTDDGTVIEPSEWSGEDFLKELEKLEQKEKENREKTGGQGLLPSATPSQAVAIAPGSTVVLGETEEEDLLTQAKQLWKLGLEAKAKGEYTKAQDYFQESLRYVEAYKAQAVKGVYTVRLIPERRDCLWRIAEYPFIYGDPFQWPKIWRRNRTLIQNPDLIQPGWQLVIPPD